MQERGTKGERVRGVMEERGSEDREGVRETGSEGERKRWREGVRIERV